MVGSDRDDGPQSRRIRRGHKAARVFDENRTRHFRSLAEIAALKVAFGPKSVTGLGDRAKLAKGSRNAETSGCPWEYQMVGMLIALALATGAEGLSEQPDLRAANAWVGLVDAKRWDDSWAAAGTLFRSQLPQAQWASAIAPVRGPLGAVSSRALKSVSKSKSLPGAPDNSCRS